MTYRDREKARLVSLKRALFSPAAIVGPGTYNGREYDFCLVDAHSDENVWRGSRAVAIEYFEDRVIPWHDGHGPKRQRPSNHLCCSQTSCVNAFAPFHDAPDALAAALRDLGFPARRVLSFEADRPGQDGAPNLGAPLRREPGAVAFEWIGTRNYLGERSAGRVAHDGGRSRGAHFTSADFAIRFERDDGGIQLLLGEWKYTEAYGVGSDKRFGSARKDGTRTDRLDIYGPHLAAPGCPIVRPPGVPPEALMFDPFDQLMRLQLLAWRMEGKELGASTVTVVHVAPDENAELGKRITSAALAAAFPGATVHEVWTRLVSSTERFRPLSTRALLTAFVAHAPDPAWGQYVRSRYLGM